MNVTSIWTSLGNCNRRLLVHIKSPPRRSWAFSVLPRETARTHNMTPRRSWACSVLPTTIRQMLVCAICRPACEAKRTTGRRGRLQTRTAADPNGGWIRVDDEADHAIPHDFTVRSTGPCQLPPRNSSPIEYFYLLFTVATVGIVLRNIRDYATKVMEDMAGWIAQHPGSRMRRW